MIQMLANVQQPIIKPIIQSIVKPGTLIYTDEYDIYARLEIWGYSHKSVCHSAGEYARDEDGDGFCEVHINTIEASLKKNCRFIWGSLNLFIMLEKEGKP